MIGRLIQQQQEWRLSLCENARHAGAQALPTGQRTGDLQRRAVTKGKAGEGGVRLVAGELRVETLQIVEDGSGRIEQADMLVEHCDAIGQAADVSADRVQFA